jgi:RHS repeat-associated protein
LPPTSCPPDLSDGVYVNKCAAPAAAPKNVGPLCPRCNQTPNPIKHGTGRKYWQENALRTPTLNLDLTYDSTPADLLPVISRPFGTGWSFNYGMHVWLLTTNNAVALRPDGKFYEFVNPVSGNVYTSDPDVPDKLTKVVNGSGVITGWQYTVAANDAVESYNAIGNLTSIALRNGQTTTFTYSTASTSSSIAPVAGLLITVTDHFGRALQLTYYDSARIKSATDPAGNVFNFYYDESSSVVISGQPLGSNLTSIEFPGLHKRVFHYNEQTNTAGTNLPNALTGITDENANRFAIYQYDTSGRAVSSEHAGGVERYAVAYNGNGTTTVTDPLGSSRTNSYQTIQRVTRITSIYGPACPACGPAAQTYDTNGFLESKTDWNGNLTTYLRQDPNGRLDLETLRTEAFGSPQARTITTEWHPTFRLPAAITEPGRSTSLGYDPDGNLLSRTLTDPASGKSRAWGYTNNANGEVLTIDGPRTDVTDVTTYTYYANDATCPVASAMGCRGQVETITNPLGHVTSITSYDANGRPLSIVDPNGLTTTLEYWPRGWLKTRIVGAETTSYDYYPVGQLKTVIQPDASYLEYTYDPAHRLTEIQDNLGNKIVYTPDAVGNWTREDVHDPVGALVQTHSREYDTLNRLFKDIGGTNPLTQITQYGHDNQGNLTLVTDPLNHVTNNAYDALNRLKQVTDPNLGVTQYGYNPLDQLTSVTDPRNNATTYSVDALDNLNQQVSPDTGTTNNSLFDDAGNLKTSTDARGITATYTYDALDRVTRIDYSDATFTTYTWDACTNGKGRLCATGRGASTTFWTYDLHGRVTRRDETVGPAVFTTQYAYDGTTGRLTSMTYPAGATLTYEYHGNGPVKAIRTPGGVTLLDNASYHPFGRAKSWTWGNGTTYSRGFDLDGRVQSYTLNATNNRTHTLTYDAASRITLITDSAGAGLNQTLGYDNLDRVTSWVGLSTNQSFGYDATGNRVSLTIGANTYAYTTPGTSNRLGATAGPPPAKSFGYDGAGNLTGDGILAYGYDAGGRLVSVTGSAVNATRQYNGLGQRTRRSAQPGETTVYAYDEAGRMISEYTVNTLTSTNYGFEYVYLEGAVVGVAAFTVPALGQPAQYLGLFYVHPDHLDTPRLVTDNLNRARWRWDSDAFGTTAANQNPAGLGVFPFSPRFPGQVIDKESNTYYNYFRDYSPEIGRYVESDPIGIGGGLNLYGYVEGNPISIVDPLGLASASGSWSSGASGSWDPPFPFKWPPPKNCAGCGTGWNEKVVPDIYPEACDRHDKCYGTPGRSKLSCDWDFFKDAFGESGPSPNVVGPFIYSMGPLLGGGDAYRNAQNQARSKWHGH